MRRQVRDFVEVRDLGSLDDLIARLEAVRSALPPGSQPEVKMRGDDIGGRHLCIAFRRPQTDEEAERDARYADACRESRERERSRLHDELGFCPVSDRRDGKIRIVA